MTEDDQQNTVLSVNQNLPTTKEINESGHINVINFAKERAKELLAFEDDLNYLTVSNQNLLQKMPVRLRRRASSHVMRRIPRRFHRATVVCHPKSKRPSRRYRRRATRLLEEYCRRSAKNRWMETHLWHAKRFHMESKWHCRVPVLPNDKVFRVCHRASKRGCLALDLSYFCFIELVGRQKALLSGLTRILCPNTVRECLTNNTSVLNGEKELSTIFYEADAYPYRVIGPVKLVWSPDQETRKRKLWLWFHPAIYDSMHNQLVQIFNIKEEMEESSTSATTQDCQETTCSKSKKKVVKMNDFRSEVLRFRLIGAHSLHLLLDIISANESDFSENFCVVHCNALDPRYRRPAFKLKDNDWRLSTLLASISETVPRGEDYDPESQPACIFDADARERAFAIFSSVTSRNIAVNKNSLVAGSHQRSRYPCTVIKQCDQSYDLLVPRGLARAFWLAIIYRGAEPGSERELRRYASVEGIGNRRCVDPSFPFIGWPDSRAGREQHSKTAMTLRKKFKSRPPSRRCSYQFFGTVFPFFCAWTSLLPEGYNDDWFVLRDKSLLTSLVLRIFRGELRLTVDSLRQFNPHLLSAYIMVHVNSVKKGIPSERSIISLPTSEEDCSSPPQEPALTNHTNSDAIAMCNSLADDVDQITNRMSRPVIGFVEAGEVSLSTGGSVGIGFLSLYRLAVHIDSIVRLASRWGSSPTLLYKNTTTNQYRAAYVTLII